MVKRLDPPNPRQREFMTATSRYIAYGGARGGGKSWALRKKALLMCLKYKGLRILLLRRTYRELHENHILPLMNDLLGIATYRDSDKAFTFPNGSRLKFGYCDSESDVLQYQGQEFDIIMIDEATQFSEYQFSTLTACLRGANTHPKRFYLTCNPGGVGHEWVKRLFIDRQYKGNEKAEDYTFIKASVYDNKALLDNDQGYIQMLQNLPDDLKKAWLDGDWNVFAGQFFREFKTDTHVIRPFELPKEWRRYFVMDYGLDMLAGYWIALDNEKKAYVYKEVYKSNLIISDAANLIKSMTTETIHEYIAPPDLWNRRQETGESAAEIFGRNGVPLLKAGNDRVQGWYALREWLRPYEGESGMTANLLIFDNCTNLIRCLPALQFDERNPEDCAKEPHEYTHAPDALRYFVAGRPSANRKIQVEEKRFGFNFEKKVNPLGLGDSVRII